MVRTIRTKENHIRSRITDLQTRSESDKKVIEGYFIVFNSETELFPGAFEEVAPEALRNTLDNDIRALVNHDPNLVLGRTKNNTVDLRVDEKGLYAVIEINENDSDAMNVYERSKRGDYSNASFGFRILKEDEEIRDDGTIKWTIREIELFEISVVTFPAYEETSVQARMKQAEQIEKRKLDKKKTLLKERIKKC